MACSMKNWSPIFPVLTRSLHDAIRFASIWCKDIVLTFQHRIVVYRRHNRRSRVEERTWELSRWKAERGGVAKACVV